MSRIGKKIITIPAGVDLKIEASKIFVKGPKGELNFAIPTGIKLIKKDQELSVNLLNLKKKKERAIWGTVRSIIANMIEGVTVGFKKQLEINGIGFKAQVSGEQLVLSLGFSHPINFSIPAGITITVDNNQITVAGFDKYLVGETAARIRALKKPEPYKGKGIKYLDEVIRRKAGKVVKSGE